MSNDTDKNIVEATLLSSKSPVTIEGIVEKIGYKPDVRRIVDELNNDYKSRSIKVLEIRPDEWVIRTKPETSQLCKAHAPRQIRLSRVGHEVLAIIAYFQPVTRSEIERVRGVSLSNGTIQVLIHQGLIQLGPRRNTIGQPITFMTTKHFLDYFDVRQLEYLPRYQELKEKGLLNAEKGFRITHPNSDDAA